MFEGEFSYLFNDPKDERVSRWENRIVLAVGGEKRADKDTQWQRHTETKRHRDKDNEDKLNRLEII